MIRKEVTIQFHPGLHARPAKMIALAAQRFRSEIVIEDLEGHKAMGKSIISLLQLGAPQGSRLRISAQGEDEQEAVEALCELIQNFT
jgi:phosphocarrier protein HPr